MNITEAEQTYVTESLELLESMESALLELEKNSNDAELINQIFRAAHTIKGSAGLFSFDHIIAFTHVVENLLDAMRNCLVPVTGELITLLIRAKDHITALVNGLLTGDKGDAEEGRTVLELLESYRTGVPRAARAAAPAALEPAASGVDEIYHISLRLGRDTFRHGFDPLVAFDQLGALGTITAAEPMGNAIPPLGELNPEDCHLGWEIDLCTTAAKEAIADVFEFMEADVRILPPAGQSKHFQERLGQLPARETPLGEVLAEAGTLAAGELQEALNEQRSRGGRTGEILVERGAVRPEVVDEAVRRQEQARSAKQRELGFVRVDAEKLDALVNLMGEREAGTADRSDR